MRNPFVFVVFILYVLNVSAQEIQHHKPSDTTTTGQLLKYDANNTWKGIKHAVTRPLHWKRKDFTKFGGLILGTAILSATDESTSTFFRRQENNSPRIIQDFGYNFGEPQIFLLANAGLYSFGLFTKNEKIRKTSVLIISSSITAGYIQIFMRSLIGRARPFAEKGAFTFKPFNGSKNFVSFPSGHTILGITMAHSIAKQFNNTWIKAGIYAIGSIPGITRMIDGAHWLTDVAFSYALSIAIVDSIDKLLFDSKAYDYPKKAKKISWNFRFSGNQMGVVGTF